jgi:hypothetical protein
MTTPVTAPVSIRLRRRWPFAAAASVLATVAASVVLAVSVGTDVQTPRPIPQRQQSQRYAEELSRLSYAELAAAFGTGAVESKSADRGARQDAKELSRLSYAELAAAFGTGR